VSEVWIDPGIGFAKTGAHNLALLRHLDVLVAAGFPVVVGTSRKSFLGSLTAAPRPERHFESGESTPALADDRLEASLATAAWAISQGAAMVRVHDVAPTADLARLVA
jgi:dihydropteroate synthase